MAWIQAVTTEELEKKGRIVFRSGPKQIALMKSNGHVFALDNRCPHEGYPLSEGELNPENCVLTCNWHNWKFALTTGENISGEDNLEVYETKQESGNIWVHVPEVPTEVRLHRCLKQLQRAFENQSYDRMARELTRIHFHALDLLEPLRMGIDWSWLKLEYGMDHAYAVTADWLVLYHEFTAIEEKLICLTESLDYLAETSLRQQEFAYTEACSPFSKVAFLNAIDKQDEEGALAFVNGALEEGLHFVDLEESFTTASLLHYNDFGHSLIYVSKISKLIDSLGLSIERQLLSSLVRSICWATREDLLPEFRKLSNAGKMPALLTHAVPTPALLNAEELFGKSVNYCLKWVSDKLVSYRAKDIYDALLQNNAKNLLYFDLSFQSNYDNSVSTNIGWLDFTHGLTFANAVRLQCEKFPHLWPSGLLQMACFSGRNHKYLDTNIVESDWIVAQPERFYQQCLDQILDHGKSAPIFAAHYVKTFLAVRAEAEFASENCRRYMHAALNRFLHSPLKEKHVRRTVRQALDLVGRDF